MITVAAILIDDLTLVFGLIAGVSECLIVFILPSIFFLVAYRRTKHPGVSFAWVISAVLFGLLGVVFFILTNYLNVKKLIR